MAALQQEREALCEEQRHHRALGASIDSLVQERLKANERDKYSVFVGEPADCCCRGASGGCVCASDALVSAGDLERIVNLLLSLCSRLMRIDRALLALERDPLLQEDAAEERVRQGGTGQRDIYKYSLEGDDEAPDDLAMPS